MDFYRRIIMFSMADCLGRFGSWLSSCRLADCACCFMLWFRGQQSIRHDQIQKVQLAWNLQSRRGPLQLIVEAGPDSGVRELSINAKVFSKAAIDAVLDLGARVAEA